MGLFGGGLYAGGLFSGNLFNPVQVLPPDVAPPAAGGDIWFRDRGSLSRVWTDLRSRVWRGDPMAAENEGDIVTLYMKKHEEKTFGFDYSHEGAILSGELIVANPPPEVFIEPSGPTAGTPVVISASFKDSDGKVIKPGKGVKVRIVAPAATPQSYQVVCRAWTTNGDRLQSGGNLVIDDTIGT